MKIQELTRRYRYDGVDLPVPDHLAHDETALRAFHSTLYPAVTNADAVELGEQDGALVTEYRRTVGTKGAWA